MKIRAKATLTCLTMLPFASSAYAAVGVDVHGSTLGLGAGITAGLTEQVNVRGTFNTFTYDYDDEVSDIDYDIDLELGSVGLVLDWHPGGGRFRVSAGAFANDNEANGTGQPSGPFVEIGDGIFPASEVGTLEADLTFDDFAPYVGIGWGNAVRRERRLGVSIDVGLLFQGDPRVDFRSVGANPLLQDEIDAQIAAEEADIEDEVNEYDLYPLVSVGLSYRF